MLRIPSERPAGADAELAEALAEMKLPATLRESLQMQAELRALEPDGKIAAKLKKAKMKVLARHIHALSQGPAAPSVNVKEFFTRKPHAGALARISGMYSRKSRGQRA
jgi:hypothetical protein